MYIILFISQLIELKDKKYSYNNQTWHRIVINIHINNLNS